MGGSAVRSWRLAGSDPAATSSTALFRIGRNAGEVVASISALSIQGTKAGVRVTIHAAAAALIFALWSAPVNAQDRVTNLTLAAGATLGFSEIVASEACIQRGTCYEANRLLPDGTTKGATLGRSLIKGAGTSAAILALAKLKKRHPKLALIGSIGLVAWNGYLTKRALDRFSR